jgi:glycosidase
MRRLIEEHNPDAILLGEVDVEVEAYQDYFGNNDRLNLVLNFWLNKYFYVSLARKSARPLRNAVKKMIVPPDSCCFANWLRNHDELDLEGISQKDKQFVLDTFAPDEMNVYQRGIRRRLAPMLNGDLKRLAFCHAVLFSLPGVPVMRYGDEIGMGMTSIWKSATPCAPPCSGQDRKAAVFRQPTRKNLSRRLSTAVLTAIKKSTSLIRCSTATRSCTASLISPIPARSSPKLPLRPFGSSRSIVTRCWGSITRPKNAAS